VITGESIGGDVNAPPVWEKSGSRSNRRVSLEVSTVVSNVHKPYENNDLIIDSCDMDIGCMHANENNTLPTGNDAEIM
jgi:hypothetical protein